jgi:uncharacterized lipoprotein NlpE involved in copper resistance
MKRIPSSNIFGFTGLFLLVLLALACGNNPDQIAKDSEEIPKVDSVQNDLSETDWSGTYTGKLPCADCDGIETILTILLDSTYTLNSRYLGMGDGQTYTTQGKFTWRDGQVIELIGETDGAFLYAIEAGTATQLDPAGAKIAGDLAANYVLTKENP